MAETKKRGLLAKAARSLKEAGPQRLGVTAVLLLIALALARMSWALPFTDNAERALFDYRSFVLAEQTQQDERILMITYDDQLLIQLQKRSPLDRGMMARALRNLDTMGAKAIGIDILFDQPQDEDAELIETLRAMQTPVAIAYAETATNADDIQYEQQLYLEEFLGALDGTNVRPASVRLSSTDSDIIRAWPSIIEGLPPLIGRVMVSQAQGNPGAALPGYEGAFRYRKPALLDRPVFNKLTINLFADDTLLAIPEVRAQFAEQVEGRYVLIGGDIIDYDRASTPFSTFVDDAVLAGVRDVRPPGMEIHAHSIAQMLDGAALPKPGGLWLWLYAGLVVLAAALTAMLELKSWKLIPVFGMQAAVFLGVPFFLHWRGVDTLDFPAIGPMLGWIVAFTAMTSAARAANAQQRRFAQGALGKYLPREMAEQILENPDLLALHGEKRAIFVLFSDLEGFTKMSHAVEPEMVAKLINRYLELISQVILDHGGVIDKFIGDAVVAFWGAPIAKTDDATRAAKAGYAVWAAGEAFRAEVAAMDPNLPKIGKTRVGLHYGEAVVGNFGGDTRIQYTALGDSMNTAARLESGNKTFRSAVMASREFASQSDVDWWRRMGRVVLSGRAQPVDLYEPAPDFPAADRAALNAAVALLDSNRAVATAQIDALAARYGDDTALQALAARSHDLNDTGAYVLGSK